MTHPSTCQCGGKGRLPKECTCNGKPCGCTFYECPRDTQEIVEWEKDIQFVIDKFNHFFEVGHLENGKYGLNGDYMGVHLSGEATHVKATEISKFFKEEMKKLLSSHSQALQERHEAEIKAIRKAIEKSLNTLIKIHTTEDKESFVEVVGIVISTVEKQVFEAFDHATHLNPKS